MGSDRVAALRFGSSLRGECFPKRNVETTSSTLNLRVPYQIYSKPWTSYWFKCCWQENYNMYQHVTCKMYILEYILWFFTCFYTCRMYPYHSISSLRVASTSHQTWSVQVGRVCSTWATLVGPPWYWTRHHGFFVVFGCFRPGSVVEFWVFLAIHSKIYSVFLGRTQKVDQTKCRVWAFPVGWGLQLTTALI